MGCGEGIAKILLIIANLAFLLVGIALLSIGVVGRINIDKVSEGIPDEVISTGVFNFLIAIGVIIFFIAFLGCCGSCKKNEFMINSYGTILILLFLVQVALGIYAFIKIKDTDSLKDQIEKQVYNLVDSNPEAMDAIQQALKCCGASGPINYKSRPPSSCYENQNTSNTLYNDGCATLINELLIQYTRILAIVVISVSAVEVIGAVLAFGLAYCIKDKRQVY